MDIGAEFDVRGLLHRGGLDQSGHEVAHEAAPPFRAAPRAGADRPTGSAGGPKGLGGRQIEGRQAVREMLIAGRRKVHEIWISAELEGDAGVDDIVIRGAKEPALRAQMTRVADDLRAVTLVPGAGHWIQQERPQEVNEILIQFLRGTAADFSQASGAATSKL